MGTISFSFDTETEWDIIEQIKTLLDERYAPRPLIPLTTRSSLASTAHDNGISALSLVLSGTTPPAREFLSALADLAPEPLTAAAIAQQLGLKKAVSVAGLTSGLTRKQAQLKRAGQIAEVVSLFQEHWDGARMSYSMTREQADATLAEIARLPDSSTGRTDDAQGQSHAVYAAIVKAIQEGRLAEPFTRDAMRSGCPGFGENTYRLFLYKHAEGNRRGNSELFRRSGPGQFELLRPLRYGLDSDATKQP